MEVDVRTGSRPLAVELGEEFGDGDPCGEQCLKKRHLPLDVIRETEEWTRRHVRRIWNI